MLSTSACVAPARSFLARSDQRADGDAGELTLRECGDIAGERRSALAAPLQARSRELEQTGRRLAEREKSNEIGLRQFRLCVTLERHARLLEGAAYDHANVQRRPACLAHLVRRQNLQDGVGIWFAREARRPARTSKRLPRNV